MALFLFVFAYYSYYLMEKVIVVCAANETGLNKRNSGSCTDKETGRLFSLEFRSVFPTPQPDNTIWRKTK